MVSKQLESCVTMETLCLEMVATVSATQRLHYGNAQEELLHNPQHAQKYAEMVLIQDLLSVTMETQSMEMDAQLNVQSKQDIPAQQELGLLPQFVKRSAEMDLTFALSSCKGIYLN